MPTFLTPYLFWIKLAGFAVALAAASATTYYIKDNVDTVTLQKVQLADSKAQVANVSASLTQLQGFIANMHTADAGYNAVLAVIDAKFAALKTELSHAFKIPLPPDCKPTADRVRSFHNALDAANAAAVARP